MPPGQVPENQPLDWPSVFSAVMMAGKLAAPPVHLTPLTVCIITRSYLKASCTPILIRGMAPTAAPLLKCGGSLSVRSEVAPKADMLFQLNKAADAAAG